MEQPRSEQIKVSITKNSSDHISEFCHASQLTQGSQGDYAEWWGSRVECSIPE